MHGPWVLPSDTADCFCASLPQGGTLERRLFYIPSFKIYNSVAGFYDYGPPGCAIKANITQVSRAAENWDVLCAKWDSRAGHGDGRHAEGWE